MLIPMPTIWIRDKKNYLQDGLILGEIYSSLRALFVYLNSHTFEHKVALNSLKNIDYDYVTDTDAETNKKT